jgi:6-pyruvoyl-tetrahydropterin synthase
VRWVVHATAEFTATHALTSYLGEPEAPHSHRWRIALAAATGGLNDEGYAIDFHALQHVLDDLVAPLAGSDLNQHPEIGTPTPSAERVAKVIAGSATEPIERLGATLVRVSVWEGPDNRVDLEL